MVPGSGTISPAFAPSTISYAETVNYAISSMAITLTTAVGSATVKVNVDDSCLQAALLWRRLRIISWFSNTITTVVTAQDGTTTKTYTLTVTRSAALKNAQLSALSLSNGTLSPVFAGATVSYSSSVANGTAMSVTPTTADVKCNGQSEWNTGHLRNGLAKPATNSRS